MYLWQLPQNLLGLLIILFTFATNYGEYWYTPYFTFGVSLGDYVIFGREKYLTALKHEQGHQVQSRSLGWLYLPLIGLPSITGNIWDRLFHTSWSVSDRIKWYYNLPWEKQADELGGVVRF